MMVEEELPGQLNQKALTILDGRDLDGPLPENEMTDYLCVQV